MANTITLQRLGNFKLKGQKDGVLTTLARDNLNKKLSKGDRDTYDVLHNLIQTNPETGKIIDQSLAPIIDPANEFLATMMNATWATLSNPESFSGTVTESGAKRVTIQRPPGGNVRIPGGIRTAGWPRLTQAYLRKIGAVPKKGPPSSSLSADKYLAQQYAKNKTFWYERRRPGSLLGGRVRTPSKRGGPKYKLGHKPASRGGLDTTLAEGAKEAFGETSKYLRTRTYLSKAPVVNSFTVKEGAERRRARTYGRKSVGRKGRKGRFYPVYGVVGEVVGPSKLTIDTRLDEHFARITIDSLLDKAEHGPGGTPKSYFSAADEDWAATALTNETRRPWIARFWSKGHKHLIAHIQGNLRKYLK